MSIPSVVELAGKPNSEWPKGRVALLPASTSREHELFKRLFPEGLPPDADLMREFVTKIRSGAIDLSPRPDSGWYDWQINALETFLLPEKGAESEKLQLMKTYKKRMLEAFEALVTKRRETHVRQLDMPKEATMAMRPLDEYMPALRLEPNPTYYLRTARGYGFLLSFLETAVGSGELAKLHGLKQGGVREPSLHEELMSMRDLFYGLYLVSCEDLGIRPEAEVSAGVKDPAACHTTAQTWLSKIWDDPDLAIDTRVAVPVFQDGERNVTRVWATLGVRLARLQVDFAKPPSVKPLQGEGDWKPLERYQMQGQSYVIPVDEFAEIELRGNRVLTRDELRALCDRLKTKEAIVSGISGQ
jgi:hypothetical protein